MSVNGEKNTTCKYCKLPLGQCGKETRPDMTSAVYSGRKANQRINGPVNAHLISEPSISINHTKPD